MPVIATERRVLSEVLAGRSQDEEKFGIEISTAAVPVRGPAAAIEVMGTPMIFIDASDTWLPYIDLVVAAAASDGGTLITQGGPARVGILVGDARGVGFNTADVTLIPGTSQNLTLVYKDAIVIQEGINFHEDASVGEIALFMTALQTQGIEIKAQRPNAVYTY